MLLFRGLQKTVLEIIPVELITLLVTLLVTTLLYKSNVSLYEKQ